jgi:hypothetical protein
MSSTPSLVGCRPTLDSGDVLALASEVGALQTEGVEPYEDRTCECYNQLVKLGSHSKESGIQWSLQEFSNPESRSRMRDGYTPERQQSTSRLRSGCEEL